MLGWLRMENPHFDVGDNEKFLDYLTDYVLKGLMNAQGSLPA